MCVCVEGEGGSCVCLCECMCMYSGSEGVSVCVCVSASGCVDECVRDAEALAASEIAHLLPCQTAAQWAYPTPSAAACLTNFNQVYCKVRRAKEPTSAYGTGPVSAHGGTANDTS